MSGTGATDAQIEAAARTAWEAISADLPPLIDGSRRPGWDAIGADSRALFLGYAREHAHYLVRPDQRIVDTADLAELLMTSWIVESDNPEHVALVARIRALL